MSMIMNGLAATLLACMAGALIHGCSSTTARDSSRLDKIRGKYLADIARFDSALVRFQKTLEQGGDDSAHISGMRAAFVDARHAYKRIEFLAGHYTPSTARAINGPPLDQVEEGDPNQIVIPPEGLQVIEEHLYAEPPGPAGTIAAELRITRANVRRLITYAGTVKMTDLHLFDAMRKEVVRVVALGLAGFDAPAAQSSITEAAESMGSLREYCDFYAGDLAGRSKELHGTLDSLLTGAREYLLANPDFISFDRLHFIRNYANPLFAELLRAQEALEIPFPDDLRALMPKARSLFESAAYDPYAFAPSYAGHPNADRVELGRILFFDPILSGNGRRACASCHRPELAFTDGEAKSMAFDFQGRVARNAPTLINAGLQAGSFYDRRVTYLEDQATQVLSNPEEMHGSLADAVKRLRESHEYRERFARAFGIKGEEGVNEQNIRVALASYVRSLTSFNSPFDRYMRGETEALALPAKRGFNLFMGKGKCGTCHFLPLFNGTVPPTFVETETEIIGVPERFDTVGAKLDGDVGRFAVHGIELHRFAFKTPTLRNIELTAPYMHNGAFATLDEVIEFYDHGGGGGLGIDLPTQTLPTDRLNFTVEEEGDLIAFMKSLTDTTALRGAPKSLPALSPMAGRGVRAVGGEY